MRTTKLTKRVIDGLQPQPSRFTAWDSEISGFGLRVTPAGEKVYVLKYRADGRQRWFTIGRHGSPWTPESARKEVVRLLGHVVSGADPGEQRGAERRAKTFGEVCDLYLAEGVAHKKSATVRADKGAYRFT